MVGCASSSAGAEAPAAAPATITRITLERSCFGCAGSSLLELRRDGTALLTVTGNARMGTGDERSRGTIGPEDFARLAELVVARGFFTFGESYEDPQLRDGAWATTTVLRGSVEKRVFRREDAAPAGLQAIEAAIEALQQRTRFTAERR